MVKKESYLPPHLGIVEIHVELGFATSTSFSATQQEAVNQFIRDEEGWYHYTANQFQTCNDDGWNTGAEN